jgi:general L-amino acid transport system substrate-binding protein
MRKILFVFVVIAMLLAACSPTPAPTQAPAPAATQAPAVAATQAPLPQATGFGEMLKKVKERGKLKCGVNPQNPGFSFLDPDGKWSGLDIDMCRAFAAAVLGSADAIEFVPTTGDTRFTMLQTGDIDVLVRSTTWTYTRDTDLGLNFAQPYFYDGQGIMVRKDSNIKKLEDLNGATICMGKGSTTELNMADVMAAKNLKYTPKLYDNGDDVFNAFIAGTCDAYSNDKSGMMADRANKTKNPGDYEILDITLSKEPLAPVVRQGDDQWFDIIRWAEFALWAADEKGITAANVDQLKASSQDAEVRRLLGVEGDMGAKLGLSNDYVVNMIKAVGNWSEMWDRNLGPNTPMALQQGINSIWTKGGLLYAPPYR